MVRETAHLSKKRSNLMTQPGEIHEHGTSEKDLLPVIISAAHVLLKLLKQEQKEWKEFKWFESRKKKVFNVKLKGEILRKSGMSPRDAIGYRFLSQAVLPVTVWFNDLTLQNKKCHIIQIIRKSYLQYIHFKKVTGVN